jgi:alginate biosynthesis protein AlgX
MIARAFHHLAIGMAALAPLAASAEPSEPAIADSSAFGCAEVEFSMALPAIEGKDGVFFRTYADLRLQHPLGTAVMAQMGRLSKALAEHGTTLIYVSIPTKSQAMPGHLPDRAKDYGYDPVIAQAFYDEMLAGLRAEGVVAPDIMRALQQVDTGDESPMFAADFHWSAIGSRAAAEVIGAAIKSHPSYGALTPKTYESRPLGKTDAFSVTRRLWQGMCLDTLPRAETVVWETVEVGSVEDAPLDIGLAPKADAEAIDIFAESAPGAGPDIVLVGTSFSDSDVNNFAGFIQEYAGLEVVNHAITGGNQFGAVLSYLTSPEFNQAPPRFLIWENPIYNNLAQFGPGPMEELITAAGAACSINLAARVTGEDSLETDLSAWVAKGKANAGASILIDFGTEGAHAVDVELETAGKILRKTRIERGDRLRPTGRFFLDLGGFWMPDLATLRVRFDRALPAEAGAEPGIYLCASKKGS